MSEQDDFVSAKMKRADRDEHRQAAELNQSCWCDVYSFAGFL